MAGIVRVIFPLLAAVCIAAPSTLPEINRGLPNSGIGMLKISVVRFE